MIADDRKELKDILFAVAGKIEDFIETYNL